jgi:hypothetical protein
MLEKNTVANSESAMKVAGKVSGEIEPAAEA